MHQSLSAYKGEQSGIDIDSAYLFKILETTTSYVNHSKKTNIRQGKRMKFHLHRSN